MKKDDNANLSSKLDLRRHFLSRYHAVPPRVVDCCAARGKIWGQLRREYAVASYWAIDAKPKKGRMKADSSRVLALPGWSADVVDVDTYGSPWDHWVALLPNVRGPLTVFLTIGTVKGVGGANASSTVLRECSFSFRASWPKSLIASPEMSEFVVRRMLSLALEKGIRVLECREAPPAPNARYLGLHLCPVLEK